MMCLVQEICRHYTNGINKRGHYPRVTTPCTRWLLMDCEKIGELSILQEYATGEVMACEVAKIRRIKKELKE